MEKPWYPVTLAVLLGAVFGVAATHQIDAQTAKALPGFVIAEQDVIDAAAAQKFATCNTPTMAAYHPQALVRGGKTDSIDGAPPKRIIVLGFDSAAAARAWVDSPAHVACAPLQEQAMHERAFIVEGLATP